MYPANVLPGNVDQLPGQLLQCCFWYAVVIAIFAMFFALFRRSASFDERD